MTEEDLRTKIIYTWLKNLGFKNEQLHFEYSFKINLGKYTYKIQSPIEKKQEFAYPRTDILVKDQIGNNLLIIEVKAPNHHLNDSDKLQAISYARLLPQIAPFTILTNGHETRIYDSITCKLVEGNCIPSNHFYVENGFKVTTPDYKFYNDTLEMFIGLSIENLLTFCSVQVHESMSLLKSDDILSGKKYIPPLFINRAEQEQQLESLIFNRENNLLFVTGSPQHGKTSFICNFVENLLEKDYPCIFYPAINIQNSLLHELESDFNWMFSESSSIQNIFLQKLQTILDRAKTRLFIFIDGLNEAGLEFISTLNKDFTKLKNLRVTFILSFTNTTAKRLFIDSVNNITALANHLTLSIKDIEALEIDPKYIHDKIITIPPYSKKEARSALALYSHEYNVKVLTKKLFHDPFLLRIIMIYYQGQTFNGNVDEIKLLDYYIQEKVQRTKEMDAHVIEDILEKVSNDIFLNDAPLPIKNILKYSTSKIEIEPLYESALLSKTYKSNRRYIEFYNEREQCYFISLIAREWNYKFETYDSFLPEVVNIFKNNAGSLALGWYFKVNPLIIKEYWKNLFSKELYEVLLIYLNSFREFLYQTEIRNEKWILSFMVEALTSKDETLVVESLKLIKYFPVLQKEFLDENSDLFIENILFNSEDELEYDPFDLINFDTLKEMHDDQNISIYDDSEVTMKLKNIILKKQSSKALEALAFCSPFVLFEFLYTEDKFLKELVNTTLTLTLYMVKELEYFYDDYMGCPGFLHMADQEELQLEYKQNLDYYKKFSKIYSNNIPLISHFKNTLEIIQARLDIQIEDETIIIEHPNQMSFKFD